MHPIPCLSTLAALCVSTLPALGQSQLWLDQFGTPTDDEVAGLAPDGAGGAFACGRTQYNLGGSYFGSYDAWLTRYDSAGNRTWIEQFGTGTWDMANALAEDAAGGAYVGGQTAGSLGGPHVGSFASNNVWLARYDGVGVRTWIVQFGSGTNDWASALAPDGPGGVFVAGTTEGSLGGPNAGGSDAWVARYDSAGNRTWLSQFGTFAGAGGTDAPTGLAADGAGGAFVCGLTDGSLGGANPNLLFDAWLARYNSAGTRLWIVQFGTSNGDAARAAAADGSGGVFVAGSTNGPLGGPPLGAEDAWLARYDSAGNRRWIRQIGTPQNDSAYALAFDGSTGVFVGGRTSGELGGTNAGPLWTFDAWLARYDSAGSQTWIQQFGSSVEDQVNALATDSAAGLFVGGSTGGDLGGANAGGRDVWLARFGLACYPDCNGDGSLTVADFGCFQTRFVAADPYADCNADGQLTVADFGCFQTRFVAGCP